MTLIQRFGSALNLNIHFHSLCRYIARPAIAEGRLSLTGQGQVRYTLKTPYRDGTTHAVFEPLDWVATDFVDAEFRAMMLNEVSYGTQSIFREFKVDAVRPR